VTAARRRRWWTTDEVNRLVWGWGTVGLEELAAELGRDASAVKAKAYKLRLGSSAPDLYSMRRVEELTGHNRKAIWAAATRVGVRIQTRQQGRRVRHCLTAADLEAIVAELRRQADRGRVTRTILGEWGTGNKPRACLDCGRTTQPYRALGRCASCYNRRNRRGELGKLKRIGGARGARQEKARAA